MSRSILIVRHGPGRGRMPGYLRPALDRLHALSPEVFALLRFHETGTAPPPEVAAMRAVVFWLGDPLRELYPQCYEEAVALATHARAAGVRIVNPPEALSNSIKSVQARLWRDAGIPTPPIVPYADRDELRTILERTTYPIILKADLQHRQESMLVCDSLSAARRCVGDAPVPGVVCPLVDVRAEHRRHDPGSIWARFHHKKRVIVLGDLVHPRHVFFSRDPIVGLARSTFRRYARLPPVLARALLRLRSSDRACIEADYAFALREPDDPDLMRRATRALGLDFAAIDYSSRPDGTILLWEANPYLYLPGPGEFSLSGPRRFEERFDAFVRALAGFLQALALP